MLNFQSFLKMYDWSRYFICNFFFLGRTQKIHHKWFSKADTFWAHIDNLIFFLHPLIYPHFDIVFQPAMAWFSAVSTKTFWWSVDWLKGVGKNKVINVHPKCSCLGKSPTVNFLSSSKKKKVHIILFIAETYIRREVKRQISVGKIHQTLSSWGDGMSVGTSSCSSHGDGLRFEQAFHLKIVKQFNPYVMMISFYNYQRKLN